MKRRSFIKGSLAGVASVCLTACEQLKSSPGTNPSGDHFMSVLGARPSLSMGFTLTHEHLFADLRPYSEQLKNPLSLNLNEVVATVLPHLTEIQKLGCKTFIDCTAVGVGRNPPLLKALAQASGMQIVTTTGAYLSNDAQFKPDYFDAMSADALAQKWLGEWHDGIDGTGIKPGMIKIGVSGGSLTKDENKLVKAAVLTHKKSGMVIGCHIGPWREVKPGVNGTSAMEQLKLLKDAGVSPARWIWIHAQSEADFQFHQQALAQGAWISYDGYRPEQTPHYVELITRIKTEGYLQKLLVSQDAGWYTATEPNGGKFNSFAPLITNLIPALKDRGFTADELAQIFTRNPAEAFQIKLI
ncbi:MAG: phosphotriesterase [Cellvibrio sp.]|nr:phosphotriesterase [Cellvibrio sp.]